VRLIEVGEVPPNLTYSLAFRLEAIQDEYSFEFDGTRLRVPFWLRRADGAWNDTKLERRVLKYMDRRHYKEHPIAVTARKLPDDTFSSTDEQVALLSVYGWERFSKRSMLDGLCYLVAGALLDCQIRTTVHEDTRSCPNDYCDTLSDVDKGMNKGALCETCSGALQTGIETGKISVRQAVAIQRIFDHVAGRRLIFVLMPFDSSFDSVYASIARAATSSGFECVRADEIHRPGVVMQSVSEMIGRAELVVADLTGRNPNVFYELGEAHAAGKNTILIRQDLPSERDVPFDLQHRRYLQYLPSALGGLEAELRKYMAQSRNIGAAE
jgi:hypothetical protein